MDVEEEKLSIIREDAREDHSDLIGSSYPSSYYSKSDVVN